MGLRILESETPSSPLRRNIFLLLPVEDMLLELIDSMGFRGQYAAWIAESPGRDVDTQLVELG